VGEVIAVGEGVDAYRIGEKVFCGRVARHAGYFCEDVSTPQTEGNLLARLPDGFDLTCAALMGVGSVAMHDVRTAGVSIGQRVLVVGAGLIGQFTAQCARAAGGHVTICQRGLKRLKIARDCGAHRIVQITGDNSWQELTSPGLFHVAFDDTAGADVIRNIVGENWGEGVLERGGKLVVIAGRDDVTIPSNPAQGKSISVLFAAHFVRGDLLELIRLIDDGVVRVDPLIQDVLPIAEAPGVYDRLRDDPKSLGGTVFAWQP
jgi:threonine dehydrogenase-like Zn-dependent dehydrogenase